MLEAHEEEQHKATNDTPAAAETRNLMILSLKNLILGIVKVKFAS